MDAYMANAIVDSSSRRLMTNVELAIGRVLSIPDYPPPEVMQACLSDDIPDPLAYGIRFIPPRSAAPFTNAITNRGQHARGPRAHRD
jgi:hypothetical protein